VLQKTIAFILVLLLFPSLLRAEEPVLCDFVIKGRIIDEHDSSPLDYSGIYIPELRKGTLADSLGNFQLRGICPGTYTFRISHVGCENRDTLITVSYPMPELLFFLEHHAEELAAALVIGQGQYNGNTTDISTAVKARDLRDPSKELGQLLSTISGVNNLQTGPTLFKPIIHGLHSDRVLIVNNGTRLEGQSWGAEHAPEIDASSAQTLRVIKGAGSVQYGTDAIGGVVAIDLAPLDFGGPLRGQFGTSFNSNNLGAALHGRLSRGFKIDDKRSIGFQAGGTYKRAGDARAPDYVLSNTGSQEIAGFAGLGYQKLSGDATWNLQSLYTYYERDLGILAATHVGNLADLELAIASDQPSVILPRTHAIGFPRQRVSHHVIKNVLERSDSRQSFRVQYDFQFDNRQEYDNRRGGRSEIPALDMNLLVNHIGGVYKRKIGKHDLSAGLDYYYKYNRNVPGTGFRVIVPNYVSNLGALWLLDSWKKNKLTLEAGLRYEYQHFAVYRFDRSKNLQTPVFQYHNYSGLFGAKWDINERIQWQSTLGIASRSPNANELFSQGVHQSAAAIEYGDSTLSPERSYKWIHQLNFRLHKLVEFQLAPYINYANNFIYLEPQNEIEVTIRGAFPVFAYKQDNVLISGIDADLSIHPAVDWIRLSARYSFIRMIQVEANTELVNTPPNRLTLTAALEKAEWRKLQNLYLGINWNYVARQERVQPNADFSPPPSAYNLLSFDMSGEWQVADHRMGSGVSVSNMLNASYRDYLDRFRYYADAPGINVNLKLYFII
jgi:iron complex outermembrane receptor protein